MNRLPHFLLLLASLASSAAGKPQPTQRSDTEDLQGTWRAVSGEIDGKPLPPSTLADIAVTFDKGEFLWKPNWAISKTVQGMVQVSLSSPLVASRIAAEQVPGVVTRFPEELPAPTMLCLLPERPEAPFIYDAAARTSPEYLKGYIDTIMTLRRKVISPPDLVSRQLDIFRVLPRLASRPVSSPAEPWLKYELHPKKSPKELDISRAGQMLSGRSATDRWDCPENIYRLENDVLTICWGTRQRPDGFTTRPGDGRLLLVFKMSGQCPTFDTLAGAWAKHCWRHSTSSIMDDYLNCSAYRKLVKLGRRAIPQIMDRYESETYEGPDYDIRDWGFLLDDITGQETFDHKAFNVRDVRHRYLEWWGKEKGKYK